MIRNETHKSVIVEKIFNFHNAFDKIYSLKYEKRPIKLMMPDEESLEQYWIMVYRNGNSTSLNREIKMLKSQ